MNILYDYQSLLHTVSGASRAFCEVARYLNDNGHKAHFSVLYTDNIFYKATFGNTGPFLPGFSFRGKSRMHNYIEQHHSGKCIRKGDFDLLHATGESLYYTGNLKKPLVITIHDMIPENYLNDSPRVRQRKTLLQIADRVVCVSENTKRELLECYPFVNPGKVDIVYHGIDQYPGQTSDNLWGNYLLFVGVRDNYKNFRFSVEALIPLLNRYKDLKILCTGRDFSKDEMQFIHAHKIAAQIKSVGFVKNDILFSLYKHAKLFFYPSLYEGFGIPILEAFTNNCPACISDTSCFPEIGGDAVAYFDPKNKESIRTVITKVLEDATYANRLRERGKERGRLFTWERSAEKMLECYKKALTK